MTKRRSCTLQTGSARALALPSLAKGLKNLLRRFRAWSLASEVAKSGEGAEDFTYTEDAPLFFTGPCPIIIVGPKGQLNKTDTDMFNVRLRYFHFQYEARAAGWSLV